MSGKYVCNFEKVTECGNSTQVESTKMSDTTDTYQSDMDTNLLGDTENLWSGEARDAANERINGGTGLIEESKDTANVADNLGKFVCQASEAIKELEDKLAALEI